ncbi:helix-turn-helix domain-containing protein [Oceanobacillus salinisoli]|uniref:helix-turn-helix domain-containing protein n=1 Tax=Oceanobacillus salinisoli TaxID=2678611 RepID=UPI0018CC4F4D|nr:helix-turn-helix domain-containing protein [Oceanobacillus salinisoli]
MDINKYVGNKIREYRRKNRLNQTQLGEKIGVKQNTIAGYERGESELNYENLHKLANVFEIGIGDLFPPTQSQDNEYEKAMELDGGKDLNIKDIDLVRMLLDKALLLEGNERKELLDQVKRAVELFEKMD